MGTLSSLLRLAVGFVFVSAASTLTALAAIPLLPWRTARIRLCNFYGKVVGRTVTWLAGVGLHVSGRERLDAAMPAIFVANHTSTLDLFLSIWLCPYGGCGVIKKEVQKIPFFGQLATLSGHLMLDRSNKERAVEALRETAALVKAKRLGIWIMPEGTRSRDGRLLPFKRGFVHLAIATGLPVVPVVYHGVHRIWEKGSLRINPVELEIEVLPPVDTKGWREETAGAHADAVQALFAARLRADQKPAEAPVGAQAEALPA